MKCAGRNMESLETVEHLKEVMGNDMVEASVDGMSILAFFVYSVLSPSNFLCCVLEYFFFLLIWFLVKNFTLKIFNYLQVS